ncbi:MAG: type VI secretion system protein TssA [Chitinispirillaceae bacterium]|nr:type VI secretion system protein TssA [Chitinispirillaceae bacterium]
MGANINYDADFDALKAEFGKIGNLDLALIENAATRVLKEKAKDIRVISFLAYALLRNDNWEGLADLFDGFAQLAAKDFDAMQPDRPRAKELGLKWMSEDRFTGSLSDRKPAEADYPSISRLLEALDKLKPVLEQKFPEAAVFPAELYKNTVAWEKACKPKPVAAAPAAGAPGMAGGQSEILETPKQAQALCRRGALFLIEKEPQKPMGYRLMRSLRWDLIEKAPPAEGGKTQLPGPNPQQRAFFQNTLAAQEWKTALEKAEAAFAGASNHLWLDLQRIITVSAEKLGEPWAAVRSAILLETACFIKRVPDLIGLQFADATPFCDEATKQWLSTEVKSVFSSGGGAAAMTAGADDPLAKEQQKANELVGSGQIEEAIDLVQRGIRRSHSERDSFRRTIIVASLLLKAKQPDMAVSMLEMVDQKITAYRVDKWEPDLAVEAWSVLVQAYKVSKAGKAQNILLSLQEKQNTILTKVSYIDPKKAILLNK